jgi:hypothetical protein
MASPATPPVSFPNGSDGSPPAVVLVPDSCAIHQASRSAPQPRSGRAAAERADPGGRTDRRGFLRRTAATGVGALAGLAGLESLAPSLAAAKSPVISKGDLAFFGAAQLVEALAVTTYSQIIDVAPFYHRLPGGGPAYLRAARQEDMSHYVLEQRLTGKPAPASIFYYPPGMFADAHTTLGVLIGLKEALIAAYLLGIGKFTMPDLCVTAARIMGVESDHRTLTRVLARDVARQDGGPIRELKGIQGKPENVGPANNNGYERTLRWTKIGDVTAALTPFTEETAAVSAGFDTTKSYGFTPFSPTLLEPLGDFHSIR